MTTAWYWFVRNLVRYGLFKASGGLTTKGKSNVPRQGPLILAPNHVSHLDPPVIACTLPRKVTFMAKEELFRNKLFGGLIRSLQAFPVKRGEGDTEAIRKAIQFVEDGRALLIFPEGTRGDGVTMLPVNRGVVMLAKRTGAPVLPIGIVGTHKKWPKGSSKPKWGRVVVSYGKPFTYQEVATSPDEKVNREIFAHELSRRILELCNAEGMGLKSGESGSRLEASGRVGTVPAAPLPE
jgi:1-acyl-sn-glycerol-3-phosphate acyltransferase